MRMTTTDTVQLSRRYLDLIGGKPMPLAEKQAFIAETLEAYEQHVNRGFISYRKSVTEAGQFAALEWSGHGERASFGASIGALQLRYPHLLTAVRGKGLLIGLEFPSDAVGYRCAGALFRRGVLVAGTYSKARNIRIEPPLGIPIELLREMLNRLEDSLKEIGPMIRSPSIAPRLAAAT